MPYITRKGKEYYSSWKWIIKDYLTIHLRFICFFIGHKKVDIVGKENKKAKICLFCGECE